MGFDEFISHVKACLELDHLRVVGRPANGNVERVAVFCGSFGLDPVELKKLNADVVVTGDVKYHQAIDALQSGLCLVDAGHYGTERIVLPELAKAVSEKFPDLSIELSTAGNDPFDYYD
jgi:putative NIF3 family GTP cyclohydrolase 1 type 2